MFKRGIIFIVSFCLFFFVGGTVLMFVPGYEPREMAIAAYVVGGALTTGALIGWWVTSGD